MLLISISVFVWKVGKNAHLNNKFYLKLFYQSSLAILQKDLKGKVSNSHIRLALIHLIYSVWL